MPSHRILALFYEFFRKSLFFFLCKTSILTCALSIFGQNCLKNDSMLCVGDNEWLQDAAGGQKTTAGAALDFVILIALCGMA